jgi:thioredoxin 1
MASPIGWHGHENGCELYFLGTDNLGKGAIMKRWITVIGLLFLGCAPSHESGESRVVVLTEANFKAEVLDSKVPVLVDFWAPWCGPCKDVAPAIEELASEFAGRAKIGKVNIDDHPDLARKYNVGPIPTFRILKNGQVIDETTGGGPGAKANLTSRLNRALGL